MLTTTTYMYVLYVCIYGERILYSNDVHVCMYVHILKGSPIPTTKTCIYALLGSICGTENSYFNDAIDIYILYLYM